MHCIVWDGPTARGNPVTFDRAHRKKGSSVYPRRRIFAALPGNALRPWQRVESVCGNRLCVAPDHLLATGTHEHFWLGVDIRGANECWPWLRGKGKGYGRYVMLGQGTLNAHRVAWESVNGPIPDGLVVDHVCRNKGCQNPSHMELVTNEENVRRDTTVYEDWCVKGHPYPEGSSPGKRRCPECRRMAAQQRRERARAAS